MITRTLSTGQTINLADLSYKATMEIIKQDFREMPYTEAMAKNIEDINYMARKGYNQKRYMIRACVETSKFARMYNL